VVVADRRRYGDEYELVSVNDEDDEECADDTRQSSSVKQPCTASYMSFISTLPHRLSLHNGRL